MSIETMQMIKEIQSLSGDVDRYSDFAKSNREDLEKEYPYKEGETVKEWVSRIYERIELPVDEENASQQERLETSFFKHLALDGNLQDAKNLSFRSAGEKSFLFLTEYIEDTPFEKNHGNKKLSTPADKEHPDEMNVVFTREPFFLEEKKKVNALMKSLEQGELPHRDTLIEIGMILRMTREQMDELLELCSENPLNTKNLYEGALILVWDFLSEMCPEWFEEKERNLFGKEIENLERKEEILSKEYEQETALGGPVDFQVLSGRQVDKALKQVSDSFKKEIREVPGWYLDASNRQKRITKRRLSTIISEMAGQMELIRKRITETGGLYKMGNTSLELYVSENISVTLHYSLLRVLDHLSDDYGYAELTEENDEKLMCMLRSLNDSWMQEVRYNKILDFPVSQFKERCETLLRELNQYYKQIG